MEALVEIDHRIKIGPVHLLKRERPIDTSKGAWERKIGQRWGGPLNYGDVIENRLAVVDASSPSVVLREYDGGVFSVIRTITGPDINRDPVTRNRLRFIADN